MAAAVGGFSQGGAVWAQLQQQQAQRAADQAETSARVLKQKADKAQSDASRAQERARTTKVEYDKAETRAGNARQNVVNLDAVQRLQDGLQQIRDRIASSTQAAQDSASVPTPTVSAGSQTVGTLVDVTA